MVHSSYPLRRTIRGGLVPLAAAVAALAFGCDSEDLGQTSAEVCVDQGGGPRAVVRMNGACRQVELLATKTFHHVESQAPSVVLSSPFRFSVPNAIPLVAGNAGNHEAHLSYTTTAGAMVDCLYRGGSSVAHPVSSTELQKGQQVLFVTCDDGAKSGDVR